MPNPARSRGRGRQVNAGQALALLLAFVLVATIGGVLAAGLVLPGVAVANGATNLTTQAFDELPTELGESTLPQKSTILASDGTVIATFFYQNRVVVPLDEINQTMRDAVIATEDKRFYEHSGVDPMGMLRAAVRNSVSDSREGASTLTQQYVKNVLIEEALSKKTKAEQDAALEDARGAEGSEGIARKLREAKLAITLEQKMSKDEILEKYLNIAQFGTSVYGVEAAAQYYFGVPAAKLTYLQAATIAGVTRSPSAWDPVRNPEASEQRRNTVLGLMRDQHYITQEQYDKGIATPLKKSLKVHQPQLGCMSATKAIAGSGFFCDYVTKVIANDPAFGKDKDARVKLLYRGGLTIKTTLIPSEQRAADKQVKKNLPAKKYDVRDAKGRPTTAYLGSSIVVVEPGTGAITAMAQNRTFNNTSETTAKQTSVNWNTPYAYGSSRGFAPGSTFKPFTLLEWLREGHSLNENIDGRKFEYPMSAFNAPCTNLAGGNYKFGNAEGSGGIMSVQKATQNSVNSAYIAMATKLNLCDVFKGADDLGVRMGTPGAPEYPVLPANVIGSDPVAPLSMANAFAAFASGGIYCTPVAIKSVTNAAGKKLKVPDADCHREIEQKYANAMNEGLSHVWEGTAKTVGEGSAKITGKPSYTASGKTGTTSHNESTWFVGYTPERAAAVWVGDPLTAGTRAQGVTVNGNYIRYMYGASIAGLTWRKTMDSIMEGKSDPGFEKADNEQVYGKKVYVPYVVGRAQGDAEAALRQAGFTVSVDPTPVASDKPAGTVAEQNPSGTAIKGSTIILKISDGSGVQPPDQGDGNGDNGGDDGGGNNNGGNGNGNGPGNGHGRGGRG
ncbi:transglycosylase domain-containing protein, partial [Cellulomonas sp. HZM]|uniref:penicillin-binding protein n=1 Tax=Cellulomonas sp. HZM TaxID=1454010 RepID=UPI00049329A5